LISKEYNPVLNIFDLSSQPINLKKWGEGHIHETYLVETKGHNPDYILQKINHNIFRDIPGMMNNIEAATGHLQQKLAGMPGHDPAMESLSLVKTKPGDSYYKDEEGNYWRMYVFIPGTVTFQKVTGQVLAAESGRVIGLFQFLLSDLRAPLIETIPDFHNINLRISQFYAAMAADTSGRASAIKDDIRFATIRFEGMKSYFRLLQEKAVTRPTHNDTKLNNILFDQRGKALCIVDLDTVMPGYVHFDYGDALRTMANTALEDEKDLSLVHFNREVYDAFTKAYLDAASSFLNDEEKALLPYAPVYLTFIIGLRFLTDHLNGDVYFRIHHPGHNLERAKVQFRLVEEIEKSLDL
jgi:hypothetical protein